MHRGTWLRRAAPDLAGVRYRWLLCGALGLLTGARACGDARSETGASKRATTVSKASADAPRDAAQCDTTGILIPNFDLRFDRTPVTVAQFADFVAATGYVTEAETFGNSAVFDYDEQAWTLLDGAFWRQPLGPGAGDAAADHPVTQVSFRDAETYCAHNGKRLPTAAEWEAAARYRQPDGARLYPWGDDIRDESGAYRANVWQGIFPHTRRVEDGYAYTSPVEAYPPAPSGLYDMAGNVWEWTTDVKSGAGVPGDGVHRLAKGGSFLCEPGWCHGYTVDGLTNTSEETGLFHTGFRCACEAGG